MDIVGGLAHVRCGPWSLVAATSADELLLIASFVRRPPPELRIAALDRDSILRVANGVALAA
jgi:hypothetical protein